MLKVYMTGLIYFDGCAVPVKHALAPDGRTWEVPHQASLFVNADLVNGATTWWEGFRIARDFDVSIEGEGRVRAHVIEFRMPNPVTISFPDTDDDMVCYDLDTKLAKLSVDDGQGNNEPFSLGDVPQTIAEVTLNGGEIDALRFAEVGFIQWAIGHPPALQITATLKEGGESKTITLNAPAAGKDAEVVFANIHEVFDDSRHDLHSATHENPHVPLFEALNPDIEGTVVSNPGVGADQSKTGNAMMNRFKEIGYTCGDTPPCCFA